MPKIEISGNKGLVQRSGSSSVGHVSDADKTSSTGGGYYRYVREIDFEDVTINTTDNALVAAVCTLPADAQILRAYFYTTEVFNSDDEKGVDLVTAASLPAVGSAVTAVASIHAALELKSSASGALHAYVGAAQSGATENSVVDGGATGTNVAFINTDGSNTGHTITSGKVLVVLEYIGTAAAADL